jgi:hypothetical protein
MSALRALLSSIVDYAGLFPPAALDMTTAVRNYISYQADAASWMLGRFVVPAARLDELHESYSLVAHSSWSSLRLSVVLGSDTSADIATVRRFKSAHGRTYSVDVIEARLSTVESISRTATMIDGEFELFAELPLDPDPAPLIAAVARMGVSAKLRTGGVTPDAFPPATLVVRFIRDCLRAQVRFKATAGLHHPLRAEYALTYDANAPRGMMFGYLNVFLAAAFMASGLGDADAVQFLEEGDATAIVVSSESIVWRGHTVSAAQLSQMREQAAVSFGSCSFREPVDELQILSPVI